MRQYELLLRTRLDDIPPALRSAAVAGLAAALHEDAAATRERLAAGRLRIATPDGADAARELRDTLRQWGWDCELVEHEVASGAPAAAARVTCPACHVQSPADARYCGACGTSLAGLVARAPSADEESHGVVEELANTLSGVTGLGRIERFSLTDLFSEVFRPRSQTEREEYLQVGTRRSTPPLARVQTNWPKPWLFARALGASLLLYVVLWAGWLLFQNKNLIPGMLAVGSFAVPLAAFLVFFEFNTPRNVSLPLVLRLLLVGGALSLFISLVLFEVGADLETLFHASAAGFVEETGKLAAVVIATRRLSPVRYRYILNGLLFGAAVGTGFSVFESAGYAFRALLETRSVDAMISTIKFRGVLSPFGHVVYTGLTAAALWRVKGARPFRSTMLADGRFLRVFLLAVALHFLWNYDFPSPSLSIASMVLTSVVGWVVIISMVQEGLRQVRAEQLLATRTGTANATAH